MLNPVSSTQSSAAVATAIKTAPAPGADKQAALDAALQVLKSIAVTEPDSPAVERLATLILAAGRTGEDLLLKLADTVAKPLGLVRNPGEPVRDFYIRIANTIEKLPLQQRMVVEMRAGLKPLGIQIGDLAKAFREPGSPLAARIAAQFELPQSILRTPPAAAATQSYLDDGAGRHQSTETMQAQSAARATASGENLFSDSKIRLGQATISEPDVKTLQSRLTEAFVETMAAGDEIKLPAVTHQSEAEPSAKIVPDLPDIPQDLAQLASQTAGDPMRPAELTARSFSGQASAISRKTAVEIKVLANVLASTPELGRLASDTTKTALPVSSSLALPLPRAHPDLAERLTQGLAALVHELRDQLLDAPQARDNTAKTVPEASDRNPQAKGKQTADLRQPTMMILRGLTEVVSQIADKTAETLRSVMDLPVDGKVAVPKALLAPHHDERIATDIVSAKPQDIVPDTRTMPESASRLDEADLALTSETAANTQSETRRAAEATENEGRNPASQSQLAEQEAQSFAAPVPIGFASIPYPIEDETGLPKRKRAQDDADEQSGESGDMAGDEQGPDGDPQDNRKARSEWDDIGEEPEDLPPLGRSASDADRAFRQYQRMRGF